MKDTSFTFCADESPQAGVRRIADGSIEAALRRARHPTRDPAEDVHFFRTTTKRLRALLQLIRPVIARTTFERENARLKSAAMHLAPFRERSVIGTTLQALGKTAAVLRQSGLATAPATGNRRDAMRQAARDLEQSRRGFQRLQIRGKGWEVIGPGLMRVYRQTRQRMKSACSDPDDREFHRWRIRVKQLYYQLEWLELVWPNRFALMRQRLRKLGENLGADHDLVVLCGLFEKLPATSGDAVEIKRVKRAAVKKSKRLREASARLGATALDERPRQFLRHCEHHWRTWEKRG